MQHLKVDDIRHLIIQESEGKDGEGSLTPDSCYIGNGVDGG